MNMKKSLVILLALSLMVTATACKVKVDKNYKIPEPQLDTSPIVLKQFEQPTGPVAVMKTSMGDIEIALFPDEAPKAVENFITHAKNGYYDGLIFHRVMNNFMIQGGDPLGNGTGGESVWGEDFEDEFSPNLHNFRGALSMANSGANTNGSQFFIVQATTADASSLISSNYYNELLAEGQARIDAKAAELKTQEELDAYVKAEEENLKALVEAGPTQEYTDRWQPVVDKYSELGGTPWLDGAHTVFGQVTSGMDVVDAIAAVETSSDKPLEDVVILSIQIKE